MKKNSLLLSCLVLIITPLSGCIEDGQSVTGRAERTIKAAAASQARRIANNATRQIEREVRNRIQQCLPSGAAPFVNIGLGMIREASRGGIRLRAAKVKQKNFIAEYTGTVSCPCPLGTRAVKTRVAINKKPGKTNKFTTEKGDRVEYTFTSTTCKKPSSSSSSQESSSVVSSVSSSSSVSSVASSVSVSSAVSSVSSNSNVSSAISSNYSSGGYSSAGYIS